MTFNAIASYYITKKSQRGVWGTKICPQCAARLPNDQQHLVLNNPATTVNTWFQKTNWASSRLWVWAIWCKWATARGPSLYKCRWKPLTATSVRALCPKGQNTRAQWSACTISRLRQNLFWTAMSFCFNNQSSDMSHPRGFPTWSCMYCRCWLFIL